MMRKGKLFFIILFLVLFYWPNLALSHSDLFPIHNIGSFTLVLERRGDTADVYYPNVGAAEDVFPIVAFLQGAFIDKQDYSKFGTQLARYGFVVVIPNHFLFGPLAPFPDEFVILDVLAQMKAEDQNPNSDLYRIVDTDRMGLAGHSVGGAVALLAIGRRCQPPFCVPPDIPFPLPDEVRAGAFYGTNTCSAFGDLNDTRIPSRCFDPVGMDSLPPNFDGKIFGINNENIPVALVQGGDDVISTRDEADATFEVLFTGPRKLIPIPGANHLDITNGGDQEIVEEIADAIGRFLRTHVGIDLSVSLSKYRSRTMPLEGATLSGNAFIFLTPLFPDGDIEQVDFWLDYSFVKTEFWAPYDLKGTYSSGKPAPFDTRRLEDGSHTVEADIVFPDLFEPEGRIQSIASTFETLNDDFRLSVSFSADRSEEIPLEGATLTGNAFIYLTPLFPDGDIDKVHFYLDGSFVKTEFWAPYDLKGTYSMGIPAPFDTRRLYNGSHTVKAKIVFAGGDVEKVASTFSVSNANGGDDDDDDD